ncbi:MAG: hypothetical protein JJW01_00700 [Alphaproteobacteria bacterium]|nr:hypothetical protein [Rickettsiales bacterium]
MYGKSFGNGIILWINIDKILVTVTMCHKINNKIMIGVLIVQTLKAAKVNRRKRC